MTALFFISSRTTLKDTMTVKKWWHFTLITLQCETETKIHQLDSGWEVGEGNPFKGLLYMNMCSPQGPVPQLF